MKKLNEAFTVHCFYITHHGNKGQVGEQKPEYGKSKALLTLSLDVHTIHVSWSP